MDIMTTTNESAQNHLGLASNRFDSSRTGRDSGLVFHFSFHQHSKVGVRGNAANSTQKVLAVLLGGFALVFGTIRPGFPQQGPTGAACTAYMNEKVVARYNCLAGIDQRGSVNFIQWEHGTASTGLGGWVRSGKNCFAASEEPRWKICRN